MRSARRRSGRRSRLLRLICIAGPLVACADSTGPLVRADEILVQVNGAAFTIERDETHNAFRLSVPWTLSNDSSVPLYVNGFCLVRLQRLEGAVWKDVPPVHCGIPWGPLSEIPPYSRKNYTSGWGSGGPIPPPPFSEPGTYRIKVNLHLDYAGKKAAAEEIGYSSVFEVIR